MTREETILEVPTHKPGYDVVAIRAADLPHITDASLEADGIPMTREVLLRLFEEAVELMKEFKPSDRVRACADETLKGEWEVEPVGYSPLTDPLLDEPEGHA